MDAWDKLAKILTMTEGYPDDTKIFRLEEKSGSLSETF